MKKYLLSIVIFAFAEKQFSQTVIGGGIAQSSAVLTINGNDKGVLLPRLSTAQRTGIVSPPDGLMVYDITTNGTWYYAGNRWLQQYDSLNTLWRLQLNAGFTASVFNTAGLRWGINTSAAASTMQINNTLITGMKFTNIFSGQTSTDGASFAMGNAADLNISNTETGGISFENAAGTSLHISNTGQVGIGTKTTVAPLTFANTNGEKVNFYNSFTNASYGMGVNNNSLQIHADLAASKVQFGYGRTSTGIVNRFTVNGNGQVQLENKLLRNNFGTADLLPFAYGKINNDGTNQVKTSNVNIVKIANGHYQVSVTGANFGVGNSYLIMASPFDAGFVSGSGLFDQAHTAEVSTNPAETFFTVKIMSTKVQNNNIADCGCTSVWFYEQKLQDSGISFMVYKN